MRDRSELKNEVVGLFDEIDAQELEVWAELGRLKVLRQRACDMYERLSGGPGSREDVETYGALHDELMRKN